MANEFNTMLDQFAQFTGNYCANARKVVSHLELKRMVDVYQAGATKSVASLTENMKAMYTDLPDNDKAVLDGNVANSGGIEMLQSANQFIGPNSADSATAVKESGKLFHKIKQIITDYVGIDPNGWTKKLLDQIDTWLGNIDAIVGLFALVA